MRSLTKDEPTTEEELLRQIFSDNAALDMRHYQNQNEIFPNQGQQMFNQDNNAMQMVPYYPYGVQESNASTVSSVMSVMQDTIINSQIHLPTPLMILNLSGHSGNADFHVKVPQMNGKNKWIYSTEMKKLYCGKNISFPVKILFPAGRQLSVVISPIFEATSLRFFPVNRCYNCSSSDTSPLNRHLLRVQGNTSSHYMLENERPLVEVPLQKHSLDDNSMVILLQMSCRTSCPGGPNRHPFTLLFTLLDVNRQQIATDILQVKCCESPNRDLTNDLKQAVAQVQQSPSRSPQIAHISSSLGSKCRKKRKFMVKTEEDFVQLMVPKKYEKKVRKYVNLLYRSEKAGKSLKYFSTTDTE